MDEPIISYERLVERALRGVLREALVMTVNEGLPGEHHFYITFRTGHPDVVMPSHLKALHPEDMTIVLQHQFWNLQVTDEWFSIELSFQGRREFMHIPFEAVTAFADPYAKFGLQFQVDLDAATEDLLDDDDTDLEDLIDAGLDPLSTDRLAAARRDAGLEIDFKAKSKSRPGPVASEDKPDGNDDDKVVTLDAFRKK